jgi:hypothetical protein
MDRHDVWETTAADVAAAHRRDLEVQDRYGVKFLTYWFDESRGTIFCLPSLSGKPGYHDAEEAFADASAQMDWYEARERAADPKGLSESEREELQRLRREVADLRIDREILRKAAAYFARETIR